MRKNTHAVFDGKTNEEGFLTGYECRSECCRGSVCVSLGWMSWSVRGEEQEAGKTACTAGIISSSFGRDWRRFITCLSKGIIERVTSSTGALDCILNSGMTQTNLFHSLKILTTAREQTDVHQQSSIWSRHTFRILLNYLEMWWVFWEQWRAAPLWFKLSFEKPWK